MAQRAAIASGNWSNPAIWNGGVLPSPGDVVASNNFTVTIDQNINVDSLSNAAVSIGSIVPIMTGYTTPSGIVSSSGEWNAGYPAWRAFDGVINTAANPYLAPASPFWLSYEFTSAKAISSYWIPAPAAANFGNGASMLNWTFEAWNGSSWIVLDTVTNYLSTNWASGYTSPNFNNSTPYIKYRINCSAVNAGAPYATIIELRLYEYLSTSAVAGGGFVLNSGVTVTTINGIQAGNTTCLTYSGAGTSTIIGSINPPNTQPSVYTYAVIHNGSGTLNINGHLNASFTSNNRGCLSFTGSGILNVTGIITGGFANSPNVSASGTGTINVVGDITAGSNVTSLSCSGAVKLNLTGNVGGGSNSGRGISFDGVGVIATITGNLVVGSGGGPAIVFNAGANLTITGNIGDNLFSGVTTLLQAQSNSSYIKMIGTIFAGSNTTHFSSLGSGAINILTGPFVSSPSGILPIYVTRMNYFRTLGSYYEFRNSSTNGALPPTPPAPAIRMNSPEVGSDLPTVANVRFGTVYGVGSFTGTMRVPAASNVRLGVAVDTTVGTGAITAQDVWNVLTSGMNTTGSIGARLKNASTVDTTGNQLAAYL